MNKFYSIYRGIIIQNNDPSHAGQVKVWVPSISPSVYDNFNSLNKNKKIKLLGINKKSDLTSNIITELQIILPWCPLGMPLSNEGSTGRYNYFANVTKTSNGSNLLDNNKNDINFTNCDDIDKETGEVKHFSDKSGHIFEDNENRLYDAFDGSNKNVNNLNAFSKNYKPDTYSYSSRGEFGIPNVGAHVLVQFLEGDPHFPVVTHILYGQEDWDSVYNDTDYPGSYENKSVIKGEYNHNIDKYRSKYILNQKGGTFEINNTDNNEKIKLTHYSGSFKEFNNNTNIELAVNDDQKLVQGNKFETIRGADNRFVYGDQDNNIVGDYYRKVGNLNYAAFEAWKNEMAEIADYKQLFYIRRCNADNLLINKQGEIIAKFNSTLQSKSGSNGVNPNIKTITSGNDIENSLWNAIETQVNTITQTSYQNGINPPIEIKDIPGDIVLPITNSQYESPISESSMDGAFAPEPLKEQLQQLYQQKITQLIDIEKTMGLGGSEIVHITKDKVENIGMVMNDYGSIRIDSIGKMYNAEMKITSTSTYTKATPSPLIEYVNVPPLPGGTYTLNVCNQFNVMVGAGGVNIKSYGSANLAGTITNISGEQVNVGADKEINIETNGRLNISAEILTLRQKNRKQVLIDSTLGVSNNVIIGGSAYIEGETYLQHVTAPCEYQVTEEQIGMAGAPDVTTIAGVASDITSGGGSYAPSPHTHNIYITMPNCIKVYPHSHVFKNLPLTLTTGPAIVRDCANNLCKSLPSSALETLPESALLMNPTMYGVSSPQPSNEIMHGYHSVITQKPNLNEE